MPTYSSPTVSTATHTVVPGQERPYSESAFWTFSTVQGEELSGSPSTAVP